MFKQENEKGRRIKRKEWKKVLFAFTILCGNRWWKFYKINKERESDEGDNEEKRKNEEKFYLHLSTILMLGMLGIFDNALARYKFCRYLWNRPPRLRLSHNLRFRTSTAHKYTCNIRNKANCMRQIYCYLTVLAFYPLHDAFFIVKSFYREIHTYKKSIALLSFTRTSSYPM